MVKYTTNQINEINKLIKNSFLNQTQISEAVNKITFQENGFNCVVG